MAPDKPGKRNDGAADPDASDLDGLIAERDRVRAELERIRREKREAEIELAILKGAVELVGKERVFLVKSVFRVSSLIFFGFRHEECRPVVCFTGCPSCRT